MGDKQTLVHGTSDLGYGYLGDGATARPIAASSCWSTVATCPAGLPGTPAFAKAAAPHGETVT